MHSRQWERDLVSKNKVDSDCRRYPCLASCPNVPIEGQWWETERGLISTFGKRNKPRRPQIRPRGTDRSFSFKRRMSWDRCQVLCIARRVVHTFNLSTKAEVGGSLVSLKPTLSAERIPGHAELHAVILCQEGKKYA